VVGDQRATRGGAISDGSTRRDNHHADSRAVQIPSRVDLLRWSDRKLTRVLCVSGQQFQSNPTYTSAAMTIVLYMDHMSQPSRALHILLRQSRGLDYKIELKRIATGEHKTEALKAMNPEGKLPILTDGDFALAESHAMMRYLCNKYTREIADHWYPRGDLQKRALVDWALDWHHTNIRRGAAGLVFAHLFAKMFNPSVSEALLTQQKKEADVILRASLQRINNDFLKDDRFLMGLPEISIADLSTAEEIVMLDLLGYQYSGTTYPRIQAWLDRVRAACGEDWKVANAVLEKAAANAAKRRASASAGAGAAVDGKVKQAQAAQNQTNGSSSQWSPAGSALQTGSLMSEIAAQLSSPDGQEAVKKLQSTFKFVITGEGADAQGAVWLLDMKNGTVQELTGGSIDSTKAESTFTLSDGNFVALASGQLNPQVAFLSGKLKLGGNLVKAMAFNSAVFQKQKIKAKILEAVEKLPKKSKL
jgi:glutathione S-transferase